MVDNQLKKLNVMVSIMNSKDLKAIIRRMQYQVRNNFSEKNIEIHFADFKISHPKLYGMILENGDYDDMLDSLIGAADAVKNGEVTQEKMDEVIGFKLAQQYVYPNLDMHKETQEYVANQMKEIEKIEEESTARIRKWDEEDATDLE